ncbi:hypothetical protein NL108_009441, partial [Boleophthalmus pectinirostris]
FLTGKSLYDQISQSPQDLIKFSNETINNELKCSHSISSYDRTFWYKQEKNGAMTLLGYAYSNVPNVEDAVKDKININGDGRSDTSLYISNLTVEDSGVYYCAPSMHSGTVSLVTYQKQTPFKHVYIA